mgnify:CR=1 FL=1|tara:strand:+ start:186 stop:341 length:156 start_codon:yes stop_codon:yes gene_type:complete
MTFTNKQLWLLQSAINNECIRLLKIGKIEQILEYEIIERELGLGFPTGELK